MRTIVATSLSLFSLLAQEPHQEGFDRIKDKNELKILTPSLARREISKIKLKNGLCALIISDPTIEESAAGLSVKVGSWSDPKEFPGMAHFLEHMLFMGTKAYPDEEAFSRYIADHGGISNAYTSLDRTVYMFSVNNDAFTEGLDLFAHFFIDPLFKESQVGRELHAVDQEHAKNIQNDFRRSWMIFKETGNQDHPNRAFASGNAETLGHIPRQALIDFYDKYYSADLMHLVVYSPLPIDQLQTLVVSQFSKVQAHPSIHKAPYQPLSSKAQKGHMLFIKPIKDLKVLSLDWELPHEISKDQFSYAAETLAYAIAAGGPNSLEDHLKKENLAEQIHIHPSFFSSDHRFFSINIYLTKEGVLKKDAVIEKVFATLNLYKKREFPDYLFNDYKKISQIQYQYQSKEKAFDFVSAAAADLICEELETYPQKTKIPTSFDRAKIEKILAKLTPHECIFSLMADPALTEVTPNRREKWNGGEYAVKPILQDLLIKWNHLDTTDSIEIAKKNPFIPTDLVLIHKEEKEQKNPILILDNNFGKHYWLEDTSYLTPESIFIIGIKSPLINTSTESFVLLDLFIKNFNHKNSALLSLAEQAGLESQLEQKNFKLTLTVKGYSQTSSKFLESLVTSLGQSSCSNQDFEMMKDSLLSCYQNQNKSQPYQQAGELMSNILYNDTPLSLEKSYLLEKITYQDYIDFCKNIFNKTYIESIYSGNITFSKASEISSFVSSKLGSDFYPSSLHVKKKTLALPSDQGPYRVSHKISMLGNVTLLALQQAEYSLSKKAFQLILSSALSDTFFNTLRSQQQTGYITTSWAREVNQQLMQFFLVQSTTHEPDDLLSRFELFLEGYVKDFSAKLSQERFEEIRKNCIDTLLQKPTNLYEMTSNAYTLAFEKEGFFNYQHELALALSTLTYDQVKKETLDFLSRKNGRRIALLIEGSPLEKKFTYKEISPKILKEQGQVKLSDKAAID